jgi:hypothetical protein
MMGMEPISTMTLCGCYKATINESETIIEAQPFWLARSGGEAIKLRAGFRSRPPIERS